MQMNNIKSCKLCHELNIEHDSDKPLQAKPMDGCLSCAFLSIEFETDMADWHQRLAK